MSLLLLQCVIVTTIVCYCHYYSVSSLLLQGDEMEQLFWASQQIEIHYAPYFDSTVVNDDLNVSFDLLLEVIEKIEQEPQWVPSSWIQSKSSSWVLIDPANR